MASPKKIKFNDGFCTSCGIFLSNFYIIDAKRCSNCLQNFPMFDMVRRLDGFRKCLRCSHLTHGSWMYCRSCGLKRSPEHESKYSCLTLPKTAVLEVKRDVGTDTGDLEMYVKELEDVGMLSQSGAFDDDFKEEIGITINTEMKKEKTDESDTAASKPTETGKKLKIRNKITIKQKRKMGGNAAAKDEEGN